MLCGVSDRTSAGILLSVRYAQFNRGGMAVAGKMTGLGQSMRTDHGHRRRA